MAAVHGFRVSRDSRPLLLMSLLVTLTIPTTDWVAHRLSFAGVLEAAVDDARPGDRIRIADHTGFEWDRLHVFGWYYSPDEIEAAFGFAWDDEKIESVDMSESHHLFVFVKDQRVVGAYELFYGEGFCQKFQDASWLREEAELEVLEIRHHDRCLESPQ